MSDQQAQALDVEQTTNNETIEPANKNEVKPDERVYRANRAEKSDKKVTRPNARDAIDKAGKPETETPTPEQVKKWEGKGWLKRWKPESAKAAELLATHPELGQHWKPLEAQIDEIYNFSGRNENELGRWRQQMGPVSDMLTPYVQQWQMQGMTPQQGLGQLLAYQDALARDPDSTLPQLAQMFKPRDAAKTLQALSQAWGADLGQVAQQAPYIDPHVQQMVTPLVHELQALKAQTFQREQLETQQKQRQMLAQIDAFEQEKDGKGNPKHPFFREMFVEMVALANGRVQAGLPVAIEDIYNHVASYHPAAAEWRAKQGAEKALQAASRTNESARQASEASRNVNGSKATGQEAAPKSPRDAIQRAIREQSG